jgi:hypothetical protein
MFSYYASSSNVAAILAGQAFYAIPEASGIGVGSVVMAAATKGVRVIVVERGGHRGTGASVSGFAEGVVYFFVKSLPATLARWQAVRAR